MLTRRNAFRVVATGLLAAWLPTAAAADERVAAVATFSVLGDMVAQIGGDRVAVTTLVGADGDSHVYQPTPADARAVAEADIVFANGLGFEGWIDRLVEASGYEGPVIVATRGIDVIETGETGHDDEHADAHAGDHDHAKEEHAHAAADHGDDHAHAHGHDHGDVDAHAWQSLVNAKIYAANIAAALSQIDPAGADVYAANRARFEAEIEAVRIDIDELIASLPENRRTVITSHDAFAYFERDHGLHFESPQGITTESEASAADLARLIRQIRDEEIAAVFLENITDPRLVQQIADETGARIGGVLYSGALSGPDGPAPTYLKMMRHNAATLGKALAS